MSINTPTAGVTVGVGNAVHITANATDSDGTVTQVLFAVNGVQICLDTAAPFTCSWTPSTPGNASLTATATDNLGASTTSTPVNVTVTSGAAAFLEQGGTVVMEAENYHTKSARSSHDWLPTTTPAGFSGTSAMLASPNSGLTLQTNIETSSPEMLYQVRFAITGTYNFWVRAVGPTGSDDSIHVGTDGLVRASPAVSGTVWFWKKAGTVTIATAGLHTVHIWMREDGTSVDKLLLSKASTTPTGMGPAESLHDGSVTALAIPSTSLVDNLDDNTDPSAIEVSLSDPSNDGILPPNQPITLAAQVDDAGIWHLVFLANDQVISNCDVDGSSATCTWTPTPGDYQLQVLAHGDGLMLASTTLFVTVGEDGEKHLYLPLARR